MNCDHISRCITHYTSTDEGRDFTSSNWHHGKVGIGGQPIGFVVSTGIVADVKGVTEEEWHGTKSLHTGTGPTWSEGNMAVKLLLSTQSWCYWYEDKMFGKFNRG